MSASTKCSLLSTSLLCLAMASCNRHVEPQVQRIRLGDFQIQLASSLSLNEWRARDNDAVFQVEGKFCVLRDSRLSVSGRDYGQLTSAAVIEFQRDGAIVIDGASIEPTGLASHAVDSDGVVMSFVDGVQNVQTSVSTESGNSKTIVEMTGGLNAEVESGGVTVRGHQYGPYPAGTVIVVRSTGEIVIDL